MIAEIWTYLNSDLSLILGMAILALIGLLATIAGCIEDLESDVGSQSNPNSQVQLAPQMNFLHRIYNKAISGEPISNGLSCVIGGTVAYVILEKLPGLSVSLRDVAQNYAGAIPTGIILKYLIISSLPVLVAVSIGAFMASMIYGIYATTSYAGRVASQRRFKQPLYMDVMRYTTPSIIAHNFIVTFCLVGVAYIQVYVLGYPFPLPFVALIWGITVGAIGSSVGDVHYGAEREFQNREFGCGLNTALSGNIVRKAESGLRTSLDNVWFCAKFGGPATGIGLGLTVFLSSWITTVFDYRWAAIAAGLVIVFLMIIANRLIEVWARRTYGPYKEDTGAAA